MQALRLPLAGVLLFVTPWARGTLRTLQSSAPAVLWRMAGLSLLTAVSSVLFVASLKWAGVAVATVLSSTAPMFAIPLGLIFLGERLGGAFLAGGAVIASGILLAARE